MSDQGRLIFRREVPVAMADKGWTGRRTCLEAGISSQRLAKVTKGESVSGISMFRLRQALELDLEKPAKPTRATQYPTDVELIRNSIGDWLADLPLRGRSAFLVDLFATIAKRGGSVPELP